MEFMEFSAKTVNDAITKASIQLEASSDRLEIQIISEGSSGFLGFGSKPAIIKVRIKEEAAEIKEEPKKREFLKKEPEKKEFVKKEFTKKEFVKKEKPAAKQEELKEIREPREPKKERTPEQIEIMKKSAEEFLKNVFKTMALPVEMVISYNENNDSLEVDFSGEDMGILIGKRGQTLDSLQYLTSLVVNKEQTDYVRVKLDTENYRKRRKETLENLSRNIAYKVRKTRKPVSLEPMNAYERRIIHSALQGNKYVETYSEGNEPYRHVVVTIKR